MDRPVRKPRWLVALVASVAFHALLGVALWRGWLAPAPLPRRAVPIEFTLVHLPPLPRASVPPSVPDVEPSGSPASPRGVPGRAPEARQAAIPSVPDVGVSAPGAPDDTRPDLAWASPAAPSSGPRPDLAVRPPADVVALYAPSPPTPEGRLQQLLREDQGREKVRSGLADPFFLDLGRSMLAVWAPEKVVTDRGLSGYLKHLGVAVVDWANTYATQAASYGRSGSPFGPGGAPLSLSGLTAVPEGITTQIADQMAGMRAIADQSRTRHAALVRVVQRADGHLVSVQILRSSDDSSVDAQALRDLRDAAANLPAPTASALAGRTQVASVWEFSLEISITPPLPMITVQFDEVLGLVDARVPLDRRLFKLVRLVSVD